MWTKILELTALVASISVVLVWLVSHKATDFPAVKRLWKSLFRISWAVTMTGVLAIGALMEEHGYSVKPDSESDRIYSYNLHGKKIYLTNEDDFALIFLIIRPI
jgi:hypothetical protein